MEMQMVSSRPQAVVEAYLRRWDEFARTVPEGEWDSSDAAAMVRVVRFMADRGHWAAALVLAMVEATFQGDESGGDCKRAVEMLSAFPAPNAMLLEFAAASQPSPDVN